jgi:GDP-4-dehydro-6-deoxy-D-mannose reductase
MSVHLVTGALGSGGSYMVDYLNTQEYTQVHGIGRWHTGKILPAAPNFTMHECDMLDLGRIIDILDDVQPNYIYHLASHANVRASFDNPSAVIRNNIECTLNLLEALRRCRCVIFKPVLVLCSSSEVYGQVEPAHGFQPSALKETDPTHPVSPYAVSKLAQDAMGYAWYKSFGVKVVRTRAFTYINPRRADLFATSFAMQIARIEAGLQDVLTHGNLRSVRTILDVRDAMRAYYLAATKGHPGEVYNIGGTETMTVQDFLLKLVELSPATIVAREDPRLMRPADVTLQVPDCSLFKARTGWEPEIDIDDSIEHLLNHCRSIVSV